MLSTLLHALGSTPLLERAAARLARCPDGRHAWVLETVDGVDRGAYCRECSLRISPQGALGLAG